MTFDASGDLWVSQDNRILEYAPAQLRQGGDLTPAVTITSDAAGDLGNVDAIAFDSSGDLWAASVGGSIVEYTPVSSRAALRRRR